MNSIPSIFHRNFLPNLVSQKININEKFSVKFKTIQKIVKLNIFKLCSSFFLKHILAEFLNQIQNNTVAPKYLFATFS